MLTFRTKAQAVPSETDKAVAEYLAARGVEYVAVCLGERRKDDWVHDKWDVMFTRNRDSLELDYSTGTGHRVAASPMPADVKKASPRSMYVADWVKRNVKPHKPEAASVLHSVILDSGAVGQSFRYWCDDFGYDSDSIKARGIYDACQEIGDKFNRFFTREEREHLAELLADY